MKLFTNQQPTELKCYTRLISTLILAGALGACVSSPSKPSGTTPPPPTEEVTKEEAPPIKPNDPATGENAGGEADTTPELEALNLPAPAAGSFLQTGINHVIADAPIVRIYDGLKYTAYDNGNKKKSGFLSAKYENGKLVSILMGHVKPFDFFADKLENNLANTEPYKLFNPKTQADLNTLNTSRVDGYIVQDAGIKSGDADKAGIYTNTNNEYIWRDPAVAGWNYQTFGRLTQPNATRAQNGFQSIGLVTTQAQLPTNGKATYNGYSIGMYQTDSKVYDVTSDVRVDVNFAKRKVDFASTNPKKYEREYTNASSPAYTLKDGVAAPSLTLTASATFNAGESKFSATDLTAPLHPELKNPKKGGRLDGRFYGDKAAEVGGTFGLGGGGKTYIGGFGAKRK